MPNDYKIIQSKTSDRKPLNLRISPITIKSWFFENKTIDGLTILYPKNEIASPIKIECVSSQHPLQAPFVLEELNDMTIVKKVIVCVQNKLYPFFQVPKDYKIIKIYIYMYTHILKLKF